MASHKRKKQNGDREPGNNWYGAVSDKRSLKASGKFQRAVNPKTGRRDRGSELVVERFANAIMGWSGGSRGGWKDVRKVSFQKGSAAQGKRKT